jgi:hypothetical protein
MPYWPLDQVTAVFDAGQNSQGNFTDLRAREIGYVASLPLSDHPDLLALLPGLGSNGSWSGT